MSRGSSLLMSCCAIRVEWAAEIYCPGDRNQLSGADYQNKRSEFSQGWAIHLARGLIPRVMSEPEELQIHMACTGSGVTKA